MNLYDTHTMKRGAIPYDGLSFFYEPAKMSEEDVKKIENWVDTVVKELHARLPR